MEQPLPTPVQTETTLPPKPETPKVKVPEGITGKVKEWTEKGKKWLIKLWGKTKEAPREVLEEVEAAPEKEEELIHEAETPSSEGEKHETFSPLAKGEFLEGNMPVLTGEDQARFYSKAEEIYGPEIGSGKWSTVLDSGDSVAKFFNRPDHPYSFYELEFMRRYGGKTGLPEFRGVTVNGYGLEKIKGQTLSHLIDSATRGVPPEQYSDKIKGLIAKEQAQDLLDMVAEYHRVTQRVHGDLATSKGPENILLDEEGKIRIIDTEWERIGSQTPRNELENLHSWFTNNFGIEGLNLPETITDEEAKAGLEKFINETNDMIDRDKVFRHRVVGFKDGAPKVKISESGEILVGRLAK